MATWISLVVLSALAVSALSFPRPEGNYNIPRVGTGRRSQYYVLHSDGTYKYGHDTGEGAFESAKLNTAGDLDGEFGYKDEDGNNINLQYKSGRGGFVARGEHLPVPHPDFDAAHAEARARPDFKDPLADSDTDASYNFQFSDEGLARSEYSDADGNVRGSYTYTDEDGVTRTYSYVAGKDTGFVIEGNDLPQGPPESGATPAATRFSGNRVSSPSQFSGSRSSTTSRFSSSQAHGGSRATGTRSSNRVTSGSTRPTSTSFTSSHASTRQSHPSSATHSRRTFGTSQSSGSLASQRGSSNTDGSYAFAYRTDDHSRSETADANLNVEGQFSFVADDGIQRSVNYQSGANRGFQASGDHLPKAPESPFGNRVSSLRKPQSTIRATSHSSRPSTFRATSHSSRPSTFRATSQSSRPSGSHLSSSLHTSSIKRPQTSVGSTSSSAIGSRRTSFSHASPVRAGATFSSSSSSSRQVPFEEANTRSEQRPDGSYAFEYETSSHSRSESGDSNNNVEGKFDFIADDDGQRREIQYEAGSDTGFIAEGKHIPTGPEVPGAPSGQPTGRIVPVKEIPFVDPLADTGLDASYNFAFDSEQYSRSEVADADGNVQGSYTVVEDDGTRRTYNFRAGKGVGFETQEVSVSRGSPPAKPPTSSVSSSASSAFRRTNTGISTSSGGSSSPSSSTFRAAGGTTSSRHPTSHSSSSASLGNRVTSSSSSTSRFSGGSGLRPSSFTAPSSTSSSHSFRQQASGSSSSSRTPLRSAFKPLSTQEVFPGFQLHQYDASKNPEKFGYVLTFDN